MIGFGLALVSIAVAILAGAGWDGAFGAVFMHPADYLLIVATFAVVASRYGLRATFRQLSRLDACSGDFRASVLLATAQMGLVFSSLGLILTLGSLGGGPEAVGSTVPRFIVPIVLAGIPSAWILSLPRGPHSSHPPTAAGLGVLSFGLMSGLFRQSITLWTIST